MTAVSESVVEARIRRALRREGEVLVKTRPGNTAEKAEFGDYYTVNPHTGNPERWKCDLGELVRECGVLRAGEVLG